MMTVKNYALIAGGVVENCAMVDSSDAETLAALRQQYAAVVLLTEGAGIGWGWNGKKFSAPAAPPAPAPALRPAVVLESIAADSYYNAHTIVADTMVEVRTVVGAVLTISARMEVGGQLYPANEAFDMPITSVDGRVYPKRVLFEAGRATFTITMTEPRIWNVTEEMINSSLPPEKHMRFAGLRVVAAEI